MVIYLEGEVDESLKLDEMTPRQIVAELDIIIEGAADLELAQRIGAAGDHSRKTNHKQKSEHEDGR